MTDPTTDRDVLAALAQDLLVERRRARRWGIFFKVIFAGVALLSLASVLAAFGARERICLDKCTALVELRGEMDVTSRASAERVIAGLQAAFRNSGTKGVLLRINSPGGSPVQAGQIYDEVRRLRAKHPDIPVHAVVEEIAASGGLRLRPGRRGARERHRRDRGRGLRRHESVSRRIYELSREVILFQRASKPLAGMLAHLIGDPNVDDEERSYLRDVQDHALRVQEQVDGFRQLLENILSVNLTLETKTLSEVSVAQNEEVKRISAWAAILFAPTLIGTIYGMNFEHMPELGWRAGYPLALGLMVATSVVLYLVFKRRGWI